MTRSSDRDWYSDGYAEGIRQARYELLSADSIPDAVRRLEALLVADHQSRKERRQAYLPVHGRPTPT